MLNYIPNAVNSNNIQNIDDELRKILHCNFNDYNFLEEKVLNHFGLNMICQNVMMVNNHFRINKFAYANSLRFLK